MDAYSRSTIASAERFLRRCLANLEAARSAPLHAASAYVAQAQGDAELALSTLERAVRIDAMVEDMMATREAAE